MTNEAWIAGKNVEQANGCRQIVETGSVPFISLVVNSNRKYSPRTVPESVRELANYLYVLGGCRKGHPVDDWLEAEKRLNETIRSDGAERLIKALAGAAAAWMAAGVGGKHRDSEFTPPLRWGAV